MPNINTAAKIAPPPSACRFPLSVCATTIVAVVVCTVKTVAPLLPEVIVMLAGFKLQVGRLCAPVGELDSVQISFIVPEYVLPERRVAVAVMPVPGGTDVRLLMVIANCETVTLVSAVNVP